MTISKLLAGTVLGAALLWAPVAMACGYDCGYAGTPSWFTGTSYIVGPGGYTGASNIYGGGGYSTGPIYLYQNQPYAAGVGYGGYGGYNSYGSTYGGYNWQQYVPAHAQQYIGGYGYSNSYGSMQGTYNPIYGYGGMMGGYQYAY